MATLKQLRDRIANKIRRVGDPVITDTTGGVIDQAINAAKRQMCLDYSFKEMQEVAQIQLVENTKNYAFPQLFKHLEEGDDEGGAPVRIISAADETIVAPLEQYDKSKFDRLVVIDDPTPRVFDVVEIDNTLEGLPLAFSIYRNELWLFPVTTDATKAADHKIEINYYEIPADYVADDEEDWFLTNAEIALEYGAYTELMPVMRQDQRVEFFALRFEAATRQVQDSDQAGQVAGMRMHIKG
jgi:hypothetical protein